MVISVLPWKLNQYGKMNDACKKRLKIICHNTVTRITLKIR